MMKLTFSELTAYKDGHFNLKEYGYSAICKEMESLCPKREAIPICIVSVIGPRKSGKTSLLRSAMQNLVSNSNPTQAINFQPAPWTSTSSTGVNPRIQLLTPPLQCEKRTRQSKLLVYGLDIDIGVGECSVEVYNKLVQFALSMSSIVIFSLPVTYNPDIWDATQCFLNFEGQNRLQQVGFAVYSDADPYASDAKFGVYSLNDFLQIETVDDVRKYLVEIVQRSFQYCARVHILPLTNIGSYEPNFFADLFTHLDAVHREGFILNTHTFSGNVRELCKNLKPVSSPPHPSRNSSHGNGLVPGGATPRSLPHTPNTTSTCKTSSYFKSILHQLEFELAFELQNLKKLPDLTMWSQKLSQELAKLPQNFTSYPVARTSKEYQEQFLLTIRLLQFYKENMVSYINNSVCVSKEEFRNQHEIIHAQVLDQCSPVFSSAENNLYELLEASMTNYYSWFEEVNTTRYILEKQLVATVIKRLVSKYKKAMTPTSADLFWSNETLTLRHEWLLEKATNDFLLRPSDHARTSKIVLPTLWEQSLPNLHFALQTEFRKISITNSNKLEHLLKQRKKILRMSMEKYENSLRKTPMPLSASSHIFQEEARRKVLAFFDQETSDISIEIKREWLQTLVTAMSPLLPPHVEETQELDLSPEADGSIASQTFGDDQTRVPSGTTATVELLQTTTDSHVPNTVNVVEVDQKMKEVYSLEPFPTTAHSTSVDPKEELNKLIQELENQVIQSQVRGAMREIYLKEIQNFHASMKIPGPSPDLYLRIEKRVKEMAKDLNQIVQCSGQETFV